MSSGIEETVTEQARVREPTKGRKNKSRDAMTSMETQLAKVELAMGDSGEHLDVLEQSLEQEVEGLKGEIKELRDVMLSTINSVAHDAQGPMIPSKPRYWRCSHSLKPAWRRCTKTCQCAKRP